VVPEVPEPLAVPLVLLGDPLAAPEVPALPVLPALVLVPVDAVPEVVAPPSIEVSDGWGLEHPATRLTPAIKTPTRIQLILAQDREDRAGRTGQKKRGAMRVQGGRGDRPLTNTSRLYSALEAKKSETQRALEAAGGDRASIKRAAPRARPESKRRADLDRF
jgi:hypothetical protein